MISVSMIVKNEGKVIRECLESLKWADEVIIVDTGSTDDTIKIAKEFKNVKLYRSWFRNVWTFKGYFWKRGLKSLFKYNEARNYSLSKCTGEWVLIVDADERVDNPEEIKKLCADYPDVDVWRIYQMSETDTVKVPVFTTRLWRNGLGIKYTKIVHETPDETIDRYGYKIGGSDTTLRHVGFKDKNKQIVKSDQIIDAIEYEGHVYKDYYLGIAYVNKKDVYTAIDYFESAVNSVMPANIKAHALAVLGDLYRQIAMINAKASEERLTASLNLIPEQNLSHLIIKELYHFVGEHGKAHKHVKILKTRDTQKTGMHQDALLTKEEVKCLK